MQNEINEETKQIFKKANGDTNNMQDTRAVDTASLIDF